ncbi:hypothetical protein [uncultured Algibacter sp.]|uniref:hypothetical protein n=1 Tax=uncultured Algibacter sp. TaxID=298659 RepID=UPI0032162A91
MKIIILIFTLLITGLMIAQKPDSLELKQVYKKFDSIKYSESNFIKMQKYYINNIELKKRINDKAEHGDKNSIIFFELLTLSYKKSIDKIGENDIKALIYSYYTSVKTQKKIKQLNLKLDSKIDSLKLRQEYLEKKMKQYIKDMDSFKKE